MTLTEQMHRAAQSRGLHTARSGARPTQRRCAAEPDALATVRMPAVIDLRAAESDADLLHFHGVASATERTYTMWDWWGPYDEVIAASAFDVTLARDDLDVPLVLAHDQLRRIARTTTGTLALSMTDEGLTVDAPSLDPTDVDVAYIVPKLRARLVDEMSFAFRIDAGEWSPDWSTYRITQIDLHRGDTAIVGYGANPYTSGGMRAAAPADLRRTLLAAAIGL